MRALSWIPPREKSLPCTDEPAGVDVCFQIASQTGIGVLDAAKDTGAYAIGVDGDQAAAFQGS